MAARQPGEALASENIAGSFFFTRGVYANEEGALITLPGYQLLNAIAIGTDTFVDVAGIAAGYNALNVGGNFEDVFVWVHVVNTTPRDAMRVWREGLGGAAVNIKTHIGAGVVAGPGRGITHVLSRGRRATFSSPAGPELFYEWTSGEPHTNGSTMFYEVWPDPNAPTVDNTFEETGVVNNATFLLGGQLVAHNGRILRLQEAAESFGTKTAWTNERVRNTDPPNSVSMVSTLTDTILDPQYPGAYTQWGSLTYGELLLVKAFGGALLIEGDIYAPQITRLPSVQSGGKVMSEMSPSHQGLVYMTDDGPYVWQGGDNAVRLGYPGAGIQLAPGISSGLLCSCTPYNGLVIFSGGGVWDSTTGSWWQLSTPPGIGNQIAYTTPSLGPTGFYAVMDVPVAGSLNLIRYDKTFSNPADPPSWLGRPIPVAEETIDITAVEIGLGQIPVMGGGVGVTVTVQFVTIDGTLSAASTFNLTGGTPTAVQKLRKPHGCRASFIQPYITLTSNGGVLIPTLTSLTVEYRRAGPIGPNL
jgi:hypothetical protein